MWNELTIVEEEESFFIFFKLQVGKSCRHFWCQQQRWQPSFLAICCICNSPRTYIHESHFHFVLASDRMLCMWLFFFFFLYIIFFLCTYTTFVWLRVYLHIYLNLFDSLHFHDSSKNLSPNKVIRVWISCCVALPDIFFFVYVCVVNFWAKSSFLSKPFFFFCVLRFVFLKYTQMDCGIKPVCFISNNLCVF